MDCQTNVAGRATLPTRTIRARSRPLVQQREPDGCEAGLHLAGLLNCSMKLESYTTGLNTSCLDPRARTRKQASARESQQGISLAGMYQRIKFPDQGLLQRLISVPLIAILAGEISFGRTAVSPIEQMPAVAGRSTSPPGGLANK